MLNRMTKDDFVPSPMPVRNSKTMKRTPYLLEMDAAVWAMKHFETHLGKHFVLFTDHKPLETLGKVHT